MINNLVICERLKYPLDEGATKLTVEFIKSLTGKTVVINFGEKLEIKNITTVSISYHTIPILDFVINRLFSIIYVVKIRPNHTYYFPLCFPKISRQIYALILNKITKDFREILYQVWEISVFFKLVSKFKIGTTSKIITEDLIKKGLSAEYVSIPHPTPRGNYENKELRKKYKIQEEDFVVLHVGHAESNRGLDVLSELQRIMPNVKIIVVLSSRKEIKKDSLNPKIKVVDWYIADIYEIYALADVYVFPLKSKKFTIDTPLSIIEAKEMNLPIIATNIGAIKELLEGYPKGYLIGVRENKGMAKEIKRILEKVNK